MLTADIPSLTLRALPPLEAYDFEYYKARLTDPALLAGAVAICIFRAPLLAIPVGGARRGGDSFFGCGVHAQQARSLLDSRPGFPNLRVRPRRGTGHIAEWGDKPPACGDVARGRFFGYSDTAIAAYVRGRCL